MYYPNYNLAPNTFLLFHFFIFQLFMNKKKPSEVLRKEMRSNWDEKQLLRKKFF